MTRIAGEITIYLAAAVSSAAGFFFGALSFVPAFAAGMIIAGFGVTVTIRNSINSRIVCAALLCTSILLPASVFLRERTMISESGLKPPAEIGQISAFSGELVSDSRKIRDGKTMYILRFHEIRSVSGIRYKSGFTGTALVFGWGLPCLYRGSIITAAAPLSPGTSKEDPFTASVSDSDVFFSGYTNRITEMRGILREKFLSAGEVFKGRTGAFLTALLTGDRQRLNPEDAAVFRKAGCAHILALSGMHLGILCALFTLVLNPVTGGRSFWLVAPAVLLYIFVTGPLPSLNRAALMFLLGGLGKLFGRRVDLRILLLLSFVILLFADPVSARTLSFQLSFLALAGIIFLSPPIVSMLEPRLGRWLALPLSASLAAQTATAPLLLALFGTIRPAGIIAALVLTPLVTVFLWGGIISIVCTAVFPVLTEAASSLLTVICGTVVKAADSFSRFPGISPDHLFGKVFAAVICIAAAVFLLIRNGTFRLPVIGGRRK
ncbi:MAG: ComEC/Rec2 family competence protein [Spirochaetia bacterium]